jgi:L-asparaginase
MRATLAVLLFSIVATVAQTSAAQSAPSGQSAAVSTPPRVRLVATGGTIANRTGTRLTAEELVRSIPSLSRYVSAEFEQFANTGSNALTLRQWLDLSRRLNTLFREDAGLAGIVVTVGTDTLEELAYFLNLTVRDARPVVLVGAMRIPSALGYEGAANLLAGFRVAADDASRGRGALVVLNDEINAARDVTKTDARRLDTFETRAYGVLGFVDYDRVRYARRVDARHTAASEFDVFQIGDLPRVDVVMVYQGADGDLIRSAVDAGAKGLVIAVAGLTATSGTQDAGLQYAFAKRVPVVLATRTGSGRAGSDRAAIGNHDLAPIKARILLMLALTRTDDPAELRRIFEQY